MVYGCEVWAALPSKVITVVVTKRPISSPQISLADLFFFVRVIEKINSK